MPKQVSTKRDPKKMILRAKKKVIFEVSHRDLETFIQKEYGRADYDFVSDTECSNDSNHDFTVDGKVDDPERVAAFREQDHIGYLTGDLLNDMASRGLIEKGTYLVKVCW